MVDPTALALLLLPAVAGLHRFGVQYGYRGLPRVYCRQEAMRIAALLYSAEAILWFAWKAFHG